MEKVLKIPVDLDVEDIKKPLRAVNETYIRNLLELVKPLISARAIYKVSYIEQKSIDTIILEGVCFRSRVLRTNLEKIERIFPYVVTIGSILEKKTDACTDLLEKYCLDIIGNIALTKARGHLEDHLRSRFALNGLSYMSPGSIADWPIEEQKILFSVFNHVKVSIGVTLTENLLMIPRKSVSGIYFPTEVTFHSCQLCPRESCEGRKAPYNEDLARQYKLQG